MNAKRARKVEAIAKRYRLFHRFGAKDPELGILCWGSSSGPVREAIDILNRNGQRVAAFVPRILAPLPAAEMQAFVDTCPRILVVELSASAQFHQYLRSQIDLPRGKTEVYARSGGKPLSVTEVIRMATLEEVTA